MPIRLYSVSSNKHRASNKRHPLISGTPLILMRELALPFNKHRTSNCGAY